jgi:hypothetical protein
MNCDHKNGRIRYDDASILAEAHLAAGLEQTRCPQCGLWYWPWECPEPVMEPTGLSWRPVVNRVAGRDELFVTWLLVGPRMDPLGSVWSWNEHGEDGSFCRPTLSAAEWIHGALGDASRKLVEVARTRMRNAMESQR